MKIMYQFFFFYCLEALVEKDGNPREVQVQVPVVQVPVVQVPEIPEDPVDDMEGSEDSFEVNEVVERLDEVHDDNIFKYRKNEADMLRYEQDENETVS